MNLTKKYGNKIAVNDLSFTLQKNEIIGLVGPNGAGKTTTMNVLTGYISATEGKIFVDKVNLFEEPKKVKKKIGYAPEHPPLYLDMTVDEYLRFCYQLKQVKLSKKEHINEICSRLNLADVQKSLIRNLSRGYQQRVGIAQALIGYPEVLILDEPTVGLDPKQRIEMRELIEELGKEHTILLSSHILSEVESICKRIIFLNKGKMVGFGTPSELTKLQSKTSGLSIRVEGDGKQIPDLLGKLKEISEVELVGEKETGTMDILIVAKNNQDIRKVVSKALAKNQILLLEMHIEDTSLEEVFLEAIQEQNDIQEDQDKVSNKKQKIKKGSKK